ncbi:MAG TPA: adenosine deaminase family protein [Myxococcota bacterium]|nr:adenosine deaminase family protein [Myxococcota bacterium]HRY94192.1 adenosine deaminase family protein [Myxococcota bacterium]
MERPQITREFLAAVPKTDLHLHLDGSVRLATLIELSREAKVKLPSDTEAGLRELVFKDTYADLVEYLAGFGLTGKVMQTREQLERISYELAVDNQREGVRYVEVRFAPQLHAHGAFDMVEVLQAVSDGLERAKREFNAREQVRAQQEPPFEFGIIACAMRFFNERFSDYYRDFVSLHRYSHPDRNYSLASEQVVQAAAIARRERGLPVVGVDLAGPEEGYPPADHRDAYLEAQRNFLQKTVHAGEAYGPESIFQAITELHADRIGHGTSLLNPDAVRDPAILDKQRYVDELTQFIADRRVTLEVCLTSNQQTNPAYRRLEDHPFGEMMRRKLSVTICTDNRTVSNTTVTDELLKAVTTFGLSLRQLKNLIVYGFKRSFFPGLYAEKRIYVRSAMEYFERLQLQHFPDLDG